MANIHENMKVLRIAHEWSQEELAKRLGYTKSAISFMEKGKRNVNLETAMKMAQLFGVSLDYLTGCDSMKRDMRSRRVTS